MGIDPGSRSCGYGIVQESAGGLMYVASGTIAPPTADSLPERLNLIYREILEVMDVYRPCSVSVEEMFFAKNARSAIKLGQSRGVVLLAAAERKIPVSEYAPTRVKLALTGRGRAGKEEVRRMLSYLLGRRKFTSTDETDALAIAVCHVNLSKYGAALGAVSGSVGRRRKKRFTSNDIPA